MDDQQKRELIGSQVTPVTIVPNLWIEKEGQVERISGVQRECAIALVIGDDLTNGCLTWKERAQTKSANDTWFLFYFLVLCVEYTKLGSCSINICKETHETQYFRACRALARRFAGCEEPGDKDIIKHNIVYLHTVNIEHLNDIRKEFENVKNKIKEAEEAKKKKRKKNGDEEEEEEKEEEEDEEEIVLPPKVERYLNVKDEIMIEELYEDSACLSLKKDADVSDEKMKLPQTEKNIISKVSFTVSIVPDASGKTMGYLVRFLIHDEQWNPGTFIYDLIKQCTDRESQKNSNFYSDPWPQYLHLQGTDFPVHNMNWGRWMSCVNRVTNQKSSFESYVTDLAQSSRADNRNNMCHPTNVCSLRRAIMKLKEAGGMVGNPEDYYSDEKTAIFPLKTVRYPSNHVFWDHDKIIGLNNQFLPFAMENVEDSFPPEMIKYLKTPDPFQKDRIRDLMPQFAGYKTGNILIHMSTEADKYEDRVRSIMPKNIYDSFVNGVQVKDMAEIVKYQKILRHYNDIWMKKMYTAIPLEGSPETLNIPPQIKSMIKWFQEYDQEITRDSQLYDPEMDLFSNWVAKTMIQYEKFAGIVQPIIPFKMRGCFSVYQRREGQILYNMCLYGSHGGGKSFLTVSFLGKFCIPGTFKVIDRCTGAADQTDQSVFDEIRGQHEMDEAFVNSKHGEKHKDKVNMKKSSMTSGAITVKTLEYVNVPGFGRLRGNRELTQAQNYTEVTCSNTRPSEDAIGSRFHNVLLGESKIPVEQMNFEIDTKDKKNVITDFRVTQFLSCMFEKAMSIFAVPCRRPFMGLFNDISVRMVDALRAWGAMEDDQTVSRSLEIMTPMARELVVEKAMLLTFHTKGAPHYGKKYRHEYLIDAAPYAYCDLNILLLTWNLHSSDWIKSDFGNVLRAMYRVVRNKEWDSSKTLYEYYQQDYENKIHFKKSKNWAYDQKNDNGRNKYFIDLNYLELGGKLPEIARAVADRTNPHLKANDVEALLTAMAGKTFRPRCGANSRNGYTRQIPIDDLEAHKGIWVQKKFLHIHGFKNVIKAYVSEVYLIYLKDLFPEENCYANIKHLLGDPMDIFVNYISGRYYNSKGELVGNLEEVPPPTFEDMATIVKSFAGVSYDKVDDPFNTIPDLTPTDCAIILHGMKNGKIRKHGDTVNHYLKIGIRTDQNLVEFPRYYCESDIPMINDVNVSEDYHYQLLNLVEIIPTQKKVTFSPMAIELFDKDIILDAFFDATLCKSTKPGKRLLGWVDENDSSKFKTIKLSRELIDEKVKEFDDNSPNNAVMRANGIPFIRRGFIEESAKSFLYGVERKEIETQKSIETVEDLDRWAATKQHLICGRPFDEPVRDPEWIRKNYKGLVGTIDYPNQIIRDKLHQSASFWDPNSASKRSKGRQIARGISEGKKK